MSECAMCHQPSDRLSTMKDRRPDVWPSVKGAFKGPWENDAICDGCSVDLEIICAFMVEHGGPFTVDDLHRYIDARLHGMDIRRLKFKVE